MDPNSEESDEESDEQSDHSDEEEQVPSCKVCYNYENLLYPPVCGCGKGMANICYNCLRNTVINRDENAPNDARGYPICPDCHQSYTSEVEFEFGPDDFTFRDYLYYTQGWTISRFIALYGFIFCLWILLTIGHNMSSTEYEFQTRLQRVFYGFLMFLVGMGFVGLTNDLYQRYRQFLNRPPRVIVGVLPPARLRNPGDSIEQQDNVFIQIGLPIEGPDGQDIELEDMNQMNSVQWEHHVDLSQIPYADEDQTDEEGEEEYQVTHL